MTTEPITGRAPSSDEVACPPVEVPECSFCKRPARWTVEGDEHAFQAHGCAMHVHRALDLALFAGNKRARATTAQSVVAGPDPGPRPLRAHWYSERTPASTLCGESDGLATTATEQRHEVTCTACVSLLP